MRNASSGRHFQELAQEHGVMEVFPVMCQLVCQEAQKYLGQDSDTDPGDAIIVDALCFDFEGNLLGSASTSADGIPMRDPSVATVNVEG
jgi:cobalamin biosynthesis protein CbiD